MTSTSLFSLLYISLLLSIINVYYFERKEIGQEILSF